MHDLPVAVLTANSKGFSAVAKHRHKRETSARLPRAALVAAPVAVLATVSAVTLGVVVQEPPAPDGRDLLAGQQIAADIASERAPSVSRAEPRKGVAGARAEKDQAAKKRAERQARLKADRVAERRATRQAVRNAELEMWSTTELNLWDGSTEDATNTGLLASGEQVLVTGRERDGRVEIVVEGASRWVTAGYLSESEPIAGIGGDCTNGTSVPSNVNPSIKKVHQAVCARWPEVTTYGTWRSDGEHGQGRAVDIMISGATGWDIADYLRENASALGIEYLIYGQKIWSVERGGEGWRGMSDRGSATANHFDHVHVTVW